MPYTKPIPPGAKLVTHKDKPHARFQDEGKTVLAPLTKKGNRIRLLSKKWYGEYKDADGQPQCEPLSTDKTAAGQMLAERVKKAALKKAGLVNPFEEHYRRPLLDHLADWEVALLAGGAGVKHVKQTVACARRIIEGCRFDFINDLSASRVHLYLDGLRESRRVMQPLDPNKEWYVRKELAEMLGVKPSAVTPLLRQHKLEGVGNGKNRRYPKATAESLRALRSRGRSIKTTNLYLDAIKQFVSWLVQDRRIADNPLAHLSGGNVKLDRRHDRRALPIEELRAVIAAARQSDRSFRGLNGKARAILYSVACASGFRAEELSTLRPGSFDLDGELPTVTLSAENAKNGRTAVQPLPTDVAQELRAYLNGRPADSPVWPGRWFKKAAEMLRIELDACGIPYAVEGPDGPLYADFHALRHSYVALLDKSGATLKEAMQLARHSDPKLTMAVYGRAKLHDLSEAVQRLPSLLPAAGSVDHVSLRNACASGAGSWVPLAVDGKTGGENGGSKAAEQPLAM
jgi:integrase